MDDKFICTCSAEFESQEELDAHALEMHDNGETDEIEPTQT